MKVHYGEEVQLAGLDDGISEEQVRNLLARYYPSIRNADVEHGVDEDGEPFMKFTHKSTTKG